MSVSGIKSSRALVVSFTIFKCAPIKCIFSNYLFSRLSISSSTTDGSARVEVSPISSRSLAATLRRIRRIILPERVFGSPGAH